MMDYPALNPLLQKLKKSMIESVEQDQYTPHLMTSKKMELQRLLGLLCVTNDIDLLVKLFSGISAYLMSNKSTYELVIKCDAVYDKIQSVLSSGAQLRVVVALNFLSVLLYVDIDDVTSYKKMLGGMVRARCRTSGCLALMSDMLVNKMMYHDTWKALCRSLSAACTDCELNQSYCTHIIPVCVQKCNESNIDICLVLFSLLLNHEKNIEVFLRSNGISLFTRQFLHNDKCLRLLSIVIQTEEGLSMVIQTRVMADLRDILRMYGPESEIGQKAMIIINHVSSRCKSKGFGSDISPEKKLQNESQVKFVNEMDADGLVDKLDDTKTLIQNIMKEVYAYKQSEKGLTEKSTMLRGINPNIVKDNKPHIALNQSTQHTARNRSGISRKTNRKIEISSSNNLNLNSLKKLNDIGTITTKNSNVSAFKNHDTNTFRKEFNNMSIKCTPQHFKKDNIKKANISKVNQIFTSDNNNFKMDVSKRNDSNIFSTRFIGKNLSNRTLNEQPQNYAVQRDNIDKPNATSNLQQSFRPKFSSTPKHTENMDTDMSQSTMFSSYATNARNFHSTQTGRVNKTKYRSLKNKSLGSRMFSAINDTCTKLMKSVANIFTRSNTNIPKDSLQSSEESNKRPCSYSFLKYMQERDALKHHFVTNRSKDFSVFSMATQLCQTCDNTTALKLKLEHNEHLKKTIKKLKLGINLFGCDFKKISRTMWRQEPSMTPLLLYNLYRKLIAK